MGLEPVEMEITFVVERDTITVSHGTPKKTFAVTGVSFLGTKRQLTQEEKFRLGKVDFNPTDRIYTEEIIDLLPGDRLPFGTNPIQYFHIGRVNNPHDLDHHLEIDAELRNE